MCSLFLVVLFTGLHAHWPDDLRGSTFYQTALLEQLEVDLSHFPYLQYT